MGNELISGAMWGFGLYIGLVALLLGGAKYLESGPKPVLPPGFISQLLPIMYPSGSQPTAMQKPVKKAKYGGYYY